MFEMILNLNNVFDRSIREACEGGEGCEDAEAKGKLVSFNVHSFSIDKIEKALKVLGTRKKGKTYFQHGQPLVVKNPTGDSVLIAEAVKKPTDPDLVSITTVKAL